ncbi:hypothetical protein [Stenomitos frigidus]
MSTRTFDNGGAASIALEWHWSAFVGMVGLDIYQVSLYNWT